MKLRLEFDGVCVAKKTEESRDGKTTYFKVSVESNDEAGVFGASEELYAKLGKYKPYHFVAELNTQYNSLKLVQATMSTGFYPGLETAGQGTDAVQKPASPATSATAKDAKH